MAFSPLRKRQNLPALQREWDLILAATGFKDIEKTIGRDRVLIQFASNAYRQADQLTRESKIAYYDLLCEKINTSAFLNEVDRRVMTMYSQGAKIKQIIDELTHSGHSIHRQTCRFIIRRYESIWGIKAWSNKQQNLKNSPKKKHSTE